MSKLTSNKVNIIIHYECDRWDKWTKYCLIALLLRKLLWNQQIPIIRYGIFLYCIVDISIVRYTSKYQQSFNWSSICSSCLNFLSKIRYSCASCSWNRLRKMKSILTICIQNPHFKLVIDLLVLSHPWHTEC
jgi:hypothetical protein